MSNQLSRAYSKELSIRMTHVECSSLCNEIVIRHDNDPVAAHNLCRSIGAGLLLQPFLEKEERLSLKWDYKGTLKQILVEVKQDGGVRGLVRPHQLNDSAKTEEELFGKSCQITAIRLFRDKILQSGITESIMRDPVEDLGYYYSYSEQIETSLAVSVGFSQNPEQPIQLCQGILLQAMPGCDLLQFENIRKRLLDPDVKKALAKAPKIDNFFEKVLIQILDPTHKKTDLEIISCPAPSAYCTCTKEKISTIVKSLPTEDQEDIIEKGEALIIRCQFCSKTYEVTIDECKGIWAK
ncbi:MAG: Hsp33 family molecular chaperone HslO [Lentisphaeria bacterium]|nr:Hsp33 family molecular chaperone HslO [Lentisphaeria bacterium]